MPLFKPFSKVKYWCCLVAEKGFVRAEYYLMQANIRYKSPPLVEGWHLLEDNLLREIFAASVPAARRDGRLVCKSWKRMVGLTVTSFKTKAADRFRQKGALQARQSLLPDIIAPQRLLQLLPNLQCLDLREGVQTDALLSEDVLTVFTAMTKLHLKMQPAQLQLSLPALRSLSADIGLDIAATIVPPLRLTSGDLPTRLVELKLSGIHLCLQSLQFADVLTALTALHVDGSGMQCPCCQPYLPLLAACRELVSLTLDSVALPAGLYHMMELADLAKLTSLTLCDSVCPGMLELLKSIGSGLKSVTLQLTGPFWHEANLCRVLCQVACSHQLTCLHVDQVSGSNPLFVLSVLPFLEVLSLKVFVDDSDIEAPARLRALTVSKSLRQVSLDFTKTNRTLVSLFTCQLFAHALVLQTVHFKSDKASRFVTPGRQPYISVVELRLQNCLNVDNQGLRDTVACFPGLTVLHVSSPCVTAVGVHALACLTRLQKLSIVGCPLVNHKDLREFMVSTRQLGVLGLDPQVVTKLLRYQRKTRQDLLLDDGVCRQM